MGDIIREDKKFKLNRPITGDIKRDRIWEQWYDPKVFKTPLPKMNQTDFMFESNKGYENQVIINNRGIKTITVSEFQNIVDKFTTSLIRLGIKKGDRVGTVALSTPELIAIKYACGKIGAITVNFNFKDAEGKVDGNKFYKQLKTANPKLVFTLDILENTVSEILNLNEFDDVIKVRLPLSESTKKFSLEKSKIKLLMLSNKLKNIDVKNSMSMKEFKNLSLHYNTPFESVYEEGMPANIAFTSATTGDSKAVLLSHDANNALAMQHRFANLGLERGKKNLALVPPFLAFWDSDIIHMAMCEGIEEILELSLTYEEIPGYLKKHLPNYGIWSQYLWDSMLTMTKEEIELIAKNIDKVVVGGERAEKNQVNTFERMTGILQDAGFGATEMNTCFSVTHPNCNVVGSAGLPLPYNNVRIVDNSFNDLTYNQPGRLLVTGPAQMIGYYERPDLTNKVLIKDEEGTIWYDTGDYAYLDYTGSLVPLDRDSAPIVIDSKKIKLIDVSEKIKECPEVKLCKTSNYNEHIVTHLVFDNFSELSQKEMLDKLIETIKSKLDVTEMPEIINIVSSLPRTPLGKVDYKVLAEMTKNIVLDNQDKLGSKLNIVYSCEKDKVKVKKI